MAMLNNQRVHDKYGGSTWLPGHFQRQKTERFSWHRFGFWMRYVWAAFKINCLRLVQKYRLSWVCLGSLSLYSVLFKSTLDTTNMQRNCVSSRFPKSASSKISKICVFFSRISCSISSSNDINMATARNTGTTTDWIFFINFDRCVKAHNNTCLVYIKFDAFSYGDGSKPWYLVNPKIAGKWMFIPLKMYL